MANGGYVLSADVIGGKELAKALQQSGEVAKKALADALNKTAVDVSSRLGDPQVTPHKSGRLASSFAANTHYAQPNNLVARVGTNVEYARAQEYGLPPRVITPKSGKVLRFTSKDGRVVFARSVNHPGFKGRFYMKKAKEWVTPKMTEYLRRAARTIISSLKT